MNKRALSREEENLLLETLKQRFTQNAHRHDGITWQEVESRLRNDPEKLWSVNEMEETGGEPDVTGREGDGFILMDCSRESPKGRRSVCYDHTALESRKKHKPENSAKTAASEIGIEILTEDDYRELQSIEAFDLKTSSWIETPEDVRNLGGALFCDHRYGRTFTYHNGAESYYASRGFRGKLQV